MTKLRRRTGETDVLVEIAESGECRIVTTVPFLDHMLVTLGRYAGLGLSIEARGDLRHHVVEDVAISLGSAMHRFAPATCARYGSAIVPMDDALVQCAVDIGGRSWYEGPLPSSLYDHFMRSLAENARVTLHLRVLRGRDRHHVVEAAFKALGLSLRAALARSGTVHGAGAAFSTKGSPVLEVE
jgi:imidazoleglycerol-phosphate dehydratase